MTKRLRVILFPFLSMMRIVGLNIFRSNSLEKSGGWPYYTTILMIHLVTQYCLHIPNVLKTISKRDSEFSMFLSLGTASLVEMLVAFFSLLSTLRAYDKKKTIIVKLFKIEEQLILLNMGIEYSKFRWYSRIYAFVGGMILIITAEFIFFVIYDPRNMVALLMLRYSARLASWFDIFYFLTILKIIGLYFKRINNEMVISSRPACRFNFHRDKFSKIMKLVKLHKCLRNVCKIHNDMYSLQLLWLVYFLICMTTGSVYFVIAFSVIRSVFNNNMPWIPGCAYAGTWTVLYYLLGYLVLKVTTSVSEEVECWLYLFVDRLFVMVIKI